MNLFDMKLICDTTELIGIEFHNLVTRISKSQVRRRDRQLISTASATAAAAAVVVVVVVLQLVFLWRLYRLRNCSLLLIFGFAMFFVTVYYRYRYSFVRVVITAATVLSFCSCYFFLVFITVLMSFLFCFLFCCSFHRRPVYTVAFSFHFLLGYALRLHDIIIINNNK